MDIALTGLAPRADTIQQLRNEQERQHLWDSVPNTRAATEDNSMQPCPDCDANKYDAPYDYCRVCGYQSTQRHNNHPITAQRSKAFPHTSTGQRCGHCGNEWSLAPPCCWVTYNASQRTRH